MKLALNFLSKNLFVTLLVFFLIFVYQYIKNQAIFVKGDCLSSNELSTKTEMFIYDSSIEKQSYIFIVKDYKDNYVLVDNYPAYSKKEHLENWYKKVECKIPIPDTYLIGRDPSERSRTQFLEMVEAIYPSE